MARFAALATALAVMTPAVAPVPAQAQTAAPSEAHVQASRLAALLIPDGIYDRLVGPIFDAMMMREIEQNSVFRTAIETRPEILSELREAMVPAIIAIMREELPSYRADVRDLILSRAKPEEVRTLADFFDSPTGRKFYSTLMGMMAASGGERPDNKAVEDMIASMSPAELAELERIGRSPAMATFGEISRGLGPISDGWSKGLVTKHGHRIESAVRDALAPLLKKPRK
ncbi:hypothetical protein [Sphingomonas sp. G-3-2-10]|uniref:hypothetical protein n=1 Tax=Sphingomonas sp. G-3-2-10 TaxID=2728838 RepID=UPI00146D1833|nr:hypothetical protein [Sphingomonas sp. G-3-2-10]NML07176.1 hypothetical protein [Sphingomonas sp. G-3-2-10]